MKPHVTKQKIAVCHLASASASLMDPSQLPTAVQRALTPMGRSRLDVYPLTHIFIKRAKTTSLVTSGSGIDTLTEV